MVDQVAGRAKRQTAEWTGDTRAQVEGGLQELKGGIRKAWGEAKDAVREAARDAEKDKAPTLSTPPNISTVNLANRQPSTSLPPPVGRRIPRPTALYRFLQPHGYTGG